MKLKEMLFEDSCDYYEWNEYNDLNFDPGTMDMRELKSKTAGIYGVSEDVLVWDHKTLTELYHIKCNYSSVTFPEAVLALKLNPNK